MITGIDVSGNNGALKADPLAFRKIQIAGHSFVYIKVTEGQGYAFARYSQWRSLAKEAGLVVGAYHFAQPGPEPDDAKREAAWFAKALALHLGVHVQGDLPPALDFEVNRADMKPKELVAWGVDFLRELELLTGRAAIVYTGPSFWRYQLNRTAAFEKSLLWEAHHHPPQSEPAPMYRPWTLWQYTHTLTVPKLAGRYDGNRFAGSLDELKALGA